MKKVLCLTLALMSLFSARGEKYWENAQGHIVSPDGREYVCVGWETESFRSIGFAEFLECVRGEFSLGKASTALFPAGMYTVPDDPEALVLQRYVANNEWALFYRDISLPDVELKPEACARLELVREDPLFGDPAHLHCREGLVDSEMLQAFWAEVLSQPTPAEAGLYDLVRDENGKLTNCYRYGTIYGILWEDVNLIMAFPVKSLNDLAYSIVVGEREYVLPDHWVDALRQQQHQ